MQPVGQKTVRVLLDQRIIVNPLPVEFLFELARLANIKEIGCTAYKFVAYIDLRIGLSCFKTLDTPFKVPPVPKPLTKKSSPS